MWLRWAHFSINIHPLRSDSFYLLYWRQSPKLTLVQAKMQLFAFILLFFYQSFAIATPLDNENGDNQVRDLSREHSPRNVPYLDLERRETTIPNLVPTTTVKLSTHSASTDRQTTNTNAFAVCTNYGPSSMTAADSSGTQKVMGSHRATATSSSIAASSPASQSTSSKGSASGPTAVPLAGILLLGLLGL